MLENALLPLVAVGCTGIGFFTGSLLASAKVAFIIRDKDDAQDAHSLLADKHNLLLGRVNDVIDLIDTIPHRKGEEATIRAILTGEQ